MDLVLGGDTTTPLSRVLLNDGNGVFTVLSSSMPAKPFGTDAIALDIAVGDIVHQPYPDLAVVFTKSNYQGRWIQVLINNGLGRYNDQTATRLPQVDNNLARDNFVHLVDFDGDGNEDLIGQAIDHNSGNQFFTSNGSGVFSSVPMMASQLADVYSLVDSKGDGHREALNAFSNSSTQQGTALIPDTGLVIAPGKPKRVRATHGVPGHTRVWWPYVWGATSYEVWRSSDYFSAGSLITTVTATSYDDTPVAEGTTYFYRVRAVNSAGTSAYSYPVTGKSEQPPPKLLTDLISYGPRQQQFTVNLTGWVSMASPADFNCDNIPDVVALRLLGGSTNEYPLTIALANGSGGFIDGTNQIYTNSPPLVQHQGKILIEDFNGDGRPDIFTADSGIDGPPYTGHQNTLSLSTPDCRLVNVTSTNLPQQSDFTHSATMGDVDNDGDVDIYVGNIGIFPVIPPQI